MGVFHESYKGTCAKQQSNALKGNSSHDNPYNPIFLTNVEQKMNLVETFQKLKIHPKMAPNGIIKSNMKHFLTPYPLSPLRKEIFTILVIFQLWQHFTN
jgi:hypothetical protein